MDTNGNSSKKFAPNLIPNSKVDKPIDIPAILKKLGRQVKDYIISLKKDGCRVEVKDGTLQTRALKPVNSIWLQNRYAKFAQVCKDNGVIVEAEFYAHGMKFNEICRFFKATDVTDPKHIKKLEADRFKYNLHGTVKDPKWTTLTDPLDIQGAEIAGHESKFKQDWPGRTVAWMSNYHPDLKLWPFDCYLLMHPDINYEKRMSWLFSHIVQENGIFHEFKDLLVVDGFFNLVEEDFNDFDRVKSFYETALETNWEGLVMAYKNRTYKFGRSTANSGDIFKIKDDKNEYDGVVLDIIEGTQAKKGAPKHTNELGRSVTSKLAEHREPSGIASGILSEYESHEIKVSFEGYSHDELREILENKDKFIGKWFKYKGMPPVKNVPRHAHMERNSWRDEK